MFTEKTSPHRFSSLQLSTQIQTSTGWKKSYVSIEPAGQAQSVLPVCLCVYMCVCVCQNEGEDLKW